MENTTSIVQTNFETDILAGLKAKKKSISSKYFYDDEGSKIFQKIMSMPEYYLTDSEYEIFETQSDRILSMLSSWNHKHFDLVELGAGDGLKTAVLIKSFLKKGVNFKYVPVDISEEAIRQIETKMNNEFPQLITSAMTGDYFEVLHDLNYCETCPRLSLFLGSNIGNYTEEESEVFFRKIAEAVKPGDMILTGFDLIKDPDLILKAYNDPHGYTRDFNLNLLKRINRTLNANFDISKFRHHAVYNPESGEAKSFLVSIEDQQVILGNSETEISFSKWETIHTEMSRKFSLDSIKNLAENTGFKLIENFFDKKKYFTDSLWEKQ